METMTNNTIIAVRILMMKVKREAQAIERCRGP
jgi:hypothetical protein